MRWRKERPSQTARLLGDRNKVSLYFPLLFREEIDDCILQNNRNSRYKRQIRQWAWVMILRCTGQTLHKWWRGQLISQSAGYLKYFISSFLLHDWWLVWHLVISQPELKLYSRTVDKVVRISTRLVDLSFHHTQICTILFIQLLSFMLINLWAWFRIYSLSSLWCIRRATKHICRHM